ncbi:MAG: hypothetical protein WCO09_01245 [bacterium]
MNKVNKNKTCRILILCLVVVISFWYADLKAQATTLKPLFATTQTPGMDSLGSQSLSNTNQQTPSGSPSQNSTGNGIGATQASTNNTTQSTTWENGASYGSTGYTPTDYNNGMTATAPELSSHTPAGSSGDDNTSTGAGSYSANKGGAGLKSGSSTASTAGNTGACIGGGMLAKLLTSSISSAMGKTVKNAVGGTTATATHVPTTNQNTPEATNQEAITNAHTGSFTIGGTQVGLGYDAIAWCIVNTIIDYIVNSTIAWANSGFKGNPAFLRNPGDFFKNLADQTAAQFIREVAYETGGFDICKPFRAVIATGLAKSYSKNTNIQSCSLTQMQQNMMKSSYTITTPTDWMALTKPQNNQYYSYIQAGSEMQKRIDARNNTARFDLTLNKGFLSQKKCKDDSKPESKTNPCDTTTPGSMIADSLSHTLNIPKDRLVSAQRFDQMIDAVVNNLIKVALSKLLEDTTGKAPSQSVSSDYYTAVANNSVYGANGYGTTGGMGVGGVGAVGSTGAVGFGTPQAGTNSTYIPMNNPMGHSTMYGYELPTAANVADRTWDSNSAAGRGINAAFPLVPHFSVGVCSKMITMLVGMGYTRGGIPAVVHFSGGPDVLVRIDDSGDDNNVCPRNIVDFYVPDYSSSGGTKGPYEWLDGRPLTGIDVAPNAASLSGQTINQIVGGQ